MHVSTLIAGGVRKPLALVEENFRKPTGWFGQLIGHAMAVQHRTLTVWTLGLMDVHPADQVLDVGCGGGMAIKLLVARAKHGFVAGVDYSAAMVQQARRRNRAAIQRGQVAIQAGNVLDLPYAEGLFDQVCGIETFYFWPDPLAGLSEVYRVLKPGGQITIALEMSKESSKQKSKLQKYFSQSYADRSAGLGLAICSGAELVTLLEQAGFGQTRYSAKPDKSLGWVCAQGIKPFHV